MNFDFDKNFHPKMDSLKIPKEWIKVLNRDLPDNLTYEFDSENDLLVVQPIDGSEFIVEGLAFKPNDEQKKIIGTPLSFDKIIKYIDNAQDPVEIITKSPDGTVVVNGKRMPFERLSIHSPHDFLKVEKGRKYFAFRKIDQTLNLNVSNNKYAKNITLRRVPYKSVSKMCLESSQDSALQFRLIAPIDLEPNSPMTFNISLKPIKAQSIKELVESISLYNSFVDPSLDDGKIDGVITKLIDKESQSKIFDPYTELFWNRVYTLEKQLGVSFAVPQDNITQKTEMIVNQLYYSICKRLPVRQNSRIDSLDGKWNPDDIEKYINHHDADDTYTAFISSKEETIDLLGVSLPLVRVEAGYNIVVCGYEKDGDQFKLLVDNEKKKSYLVLMWFEDENSFNVFQKDHKLLELMRTAHSMDIILDNDSNVS